MLNQYVIRNGKKMTMNQLINLIEHDRIFL